MSVLGFASLLSVAFANPGPADVGLIRIDPPAAEGAMAPRLSASGGTILLSWLEPARKSTYRLRFARYDGKRWSEPTTVVEREMLANWADVPSVTVAPGGGLLAHWAEKIGSAPYAYSVELARSEDGRRWRPLGPAHDDRTATEHGFVSVVPREDGSFQVIWLDGHAMVGAPEGAGEMALRAALIGDRVSTSEVLDARTCECCGTAAAWTDDGPIVAYRDRDHDEIRDIAVIRRVEGRWSAPQKVHDNGWKMPGCPVNGPAIAASGRDLVVAWYTGAEGGRVRAAFSRDGGRRFGKPVDVDGMGASAPLGRVDVVLEESGGAIVSWLVADDEKRARLVARRVRDGEAGTPVTLLSTSPSRASGFPRIARVGSKLLVAWTESGDPSRVRAGVLPLDSIPNVGVRGTSPVENSAVRSEGSYQARTLDGRSSSLDDLEGHVVLLNIWATWCRPCREEIPVLEALHDRYTDRGLRVIGVSVDPASSERAVRELVKELGISYAVWRDPEDRASRRFELRGLPASFLFDRRGALRLERRGVLQPGDAELERVLAAALAD